MGTGVRVFVIDDDGSLKRIPMARYERLRRHEPEGRFPEYAGRRVRCAMVLLQVAGRVPLSIERIDYYLLPFDDGGFIDTTEEEKEARLAVEILPAIGYEERSGQVINARRQFAKRRYEHEFKWRPTPAIQAAIVAAIFGKEPA
jgi:hypothetical protein